METGRSKIPGVLVCDYVRRKVENPRGAVLLLHGYQESGERIFRRLESSIPPDLDVVAPNGPFPLPERVEEGYRVGFSWYFYDDLKDEYFIDPEVAVVYLRNLIHDLGLARCPIRAIGFSQGGYLAPFLAGTDLHLKHVIGIGCRFLEDELPRMQGVRLDQIHGGRDDRVPIADAQRSHGILVSRGVSGEFRTFPEAGHRITPEMLAAVWQMSSVAALGR
jgi:predicted esterase